MSRAPKRIICLSAESADWLWRIGMWDHVVGTTAFFTQPPDVSPKPRVSGFSSGKLEDITRLEPDLVITFSDVQAPIASELIRRGIPVLATNQRTLEETEATLALLARVVCREAEAAPLLEKFRSSLMPVERAGARLRVYFEEWPDPLVAGIGWVSELIARAGGVDVFASLQSKRSVAERMIHADDVIRADPEVILASWCGKPVQCGAIAARPGWGRIAAVREGRIVEIPSEDILQPGFRLVYGYQRVLEHLQDSRPSERRTRPAQGVEIPKQL